MGSFSSNDLSYRNNQPTEYQDEDINRNESERIYKQYVNDSKYNNYFGNQDENMQPYNYRFGARDKSNDDFFETTERAISPKEHYAQINKIQQSIDSSRNRTTR